MNMTLIETIMKNFIDLINKKIDGRITTTITSSSLDDEIPSAKAINDKITSLEARITQLENQ